MNSWIFTHHRSMRSSIRRTSHTRLRRAVLLLACGLSLSCSWSFGHATEHAAPWQATHLPSGTRQLSYSTTGLVLGHAIPYRVTFFCHPFSTQQEKGTLGLDIHVQDVAALKGFPFDAFEGPDAETNGKKLLRIAIVGPQSATTVVDAVLSGWIPEMNQFAFGFAELSQRPKSTAKTVLQALATHADRVQLTITHPQRPHIKLVFDVPVADQRAAFKALLTGLR